LAPAFAFPLLPFCFKHFLSTSSFQAKEKKHTHKRREGDFLQAPVLPSHFWLLLLPSHFCPFVSNTFFWHLLLLKQKKKKKHKEKKTIEKKKM
jgi:hypothetical protein